MKDDESPSSGWALKQSTGKLEKLLFPKAFTCLRKVFKDCN